MKVLSMRRFCHNNMLRFGTALALLGGACAGVPPAQAQTASDRDSAELQEIIVTAEKRESTIQKTPISITAVSGEALEAQGISDVLHLAEETPGVSFRSAGPGQTEFEMRGLSSSGGAAATVGFYLDDIPLSAPAIGSIGKVTIDPDLFDLKRVEVLRGPQGTLYGAGSMGGTIKLVSNTPYLNRFEGNTEVTLSNTDGGGFNRGGSLMLNAPLIDGKAAVRMSVTDKYVSGWIDRTVLDPFPLPTNNGCTPFPNFYGCARGNVLGAPVSRNYQDVNWERLQNARLSLRVQPNDALNIVVNTMYQQIGMGGPSQYDLQPGTVPTHFQAADYAEPITDRLKLAGATVTYDWSGMQLSSTTGYWASALKQEVGQAEAFQTIYFLPSFIADSYNLEEDNIHQISQELRLASTGTGPFQWLAGAFYSRLNASWIQQSYSVELADFSLGGAAANPLGDVYNVDAVYRMSQSALFSELSYQITPHNKLTAGLRYFSYDSDLLAIQSGLFAQSANATPVYAEVSARDTGITPKVNWSYTPNDNLLLYATLAKGFRPGGVNLPLPDQGPNSCLFAFEQLGLKQAPISYGPDSVWNVELGEKAKLDDGRIVINGALYYMRWNDVQQLLPVACGWFFNANVGTARSYGPELEITARLSRSFTLSLNGTYTEAELTSTLAHTNLLPGAPILNIPKYTASAALAYEHPLTSSLNFTARIWETFTGPLEDLALTYEGLPAYRLAYLRAGVSNDKWSIDAFVDNLANKQAELTINNTEWGVNIPSLTRVTTNQPRTAGIKLAYRF
jgi:outer membrane receptor protein involved in Fe transport